MTTDRTALLADKYIGRNGEQPAIRMSIQRMACTACGAEALRRDEVHSNQFYEIVTSDALAGKQHSDEERKNIDRLLKRREKLLARIPKIEADLAVIHKDGVAIKDLPRARPPEIRQQHGGALFPVKLMDLFGR